MRLPRNNPVVARFDLPAITEIDFLGGAGGFSGAQIWKIKTADQDYSLRRWPRPHPDRQRLDWINLVLVHAFHNGCPFVAMPIETRDGSRFVDHESSFWEMAPWMPGVADFEDNPSQPRLENAIGCLAKFHQASAQVNLDFRKSENVAARFALLQQAEQLIGEIAHADAASDLVSVHDLRRVILENGVRQARDIAVNLEPFSREVFPVQPVIRDIWHDHVLFTGDDVTGVVDFGAMQMDHIALDISRMLGSLIGGQGTGHGTEQWQSALETYSGFRRLSDQEIGLISVLDRCSVLLGSLNWLKWILIERREFESPEQVERRIRHLISRQV